MYKHMRIVVSQVITKPEAQIQIQLTALHSHRTNSPGFPLGSLVQVHFQSLP